MLLTNIFYSSSFDSYTLEAPTLVDEADMTLEEEIKYEKEQFSKEFDTEDKWIVTYEDELKKEEVNGATGEFRYTDKDTGEVEVYNYFEELEADMND